eukprot:TRINITY_DN31576_c0_g1_i2.p1 TRINITY_DN31576_c0_g1~~TRINITY_DN31576_c0_g1_i2.p1  ORF type:complete len:427 (+),score=91.20 TRINITY_DN31576_c0_g1_i2:99-1379(+)
MDGSWGNNGMSWPQAPGGPGPDVFGHLHMPQQSPTPATSSAAPTPFKADSLRAKTTEIPAMMAPAGQAITVVILPHDDEDDVPEVEDFFSDLKPAAPADPMLVASEADANLTAATPPAMTPTAEDIAIAQLYCLNVARPEVTAGLAQCLGPPPHIAQMLGLGRPGARPAAPVQVPVPVPVPGLPVPGMPVPGMPVPGMPVPGPPALPMPPLAGQRIIGADPLGEAQRQQAAAMLPGQPVPPGPPGGKIGAKGAGPRRDCSQDFTLRMKNLPQNSNSGEIWNKYLEKGVEGITDVYLIPGKPFGFLRFLSEDHGMRALPLKIVVQGVAIDLEVATGKKLSKGDEMSQEKLEEEQHRQLQLQWKLMLQQQKHKEKVERERQEKEMHGQPHGQPDFGGDMPIPPMPEDMQKLQELQRQEAELGRRSSPY